MQWPCFACNTYVWGLECPLGSGILTTLNAPMVLNKRRHLREHSSAPMMKAIPDQHKTDCTCFRKSLACRLEFDQDGPLVGQGYEQTIVTGEAQNLVAIRK